MGGGGLAVTSSVIVSDFVPLKQRGLYQGCSCSISQSSSLIRLRVDSHIPYRLPCSVTNLLFGLGAGVGAPLGGWISDNYGW